MIVLPATVMIDAKDLGDIAPHFSPDHDEYHWWNRTANQSGFVEMRYLALAICHGWLS